MVSSANREPGITIHGGLELRRAFEAAGDDAINDLKTLNKEVAEIVAEEARRLAPFRSGKLKTTIKAFGTKSKARVKLGNKSTPYAAIIQWGNPIRNIEPNPFMTDALANKRQEVLDTWEIGLEQLLEENGLR